MMPEQVLTLLISAFMEDVHHGNSLRNSYKEPF